ncbi:MAG: histidine phosphatase family protein [Dethiobacteria bacterium]|nr:histidine phosphatase family protein [Bacillota bacterium]
MGSLGEQFAQVILIRHGETAWNQAQTFRGRKDIPLNAKGKEQAKKLADSLEGISLDGIYSSPLQRALQTAKPLAEKCNLNVVPMEAFNDLSFGEWEGLTRTEVEKRYPEAFRLWVESPQDYVCPGGESLEGARQRAKDGLDNLLQKHDGGTIAIVTHRVILKLLLLEALGLDNKKFWHLQQDNCALNVLKHDSRKGFTLVRFNETSHLHPLKEFLRR